MSRPAGFVVPPLAPCVWCGRLCRGRDADGEPRCAKGYGCGQRPVRLVPPPRAPWVPDVGTLTEEELLTACVTCDPRGER